jgi:hypothetical protein
MHRRLTVLGIAFALAAGLVFAQAPQPGKDKTSGLDSEGFITRWLILAPIPHNSDMPDVAVLAQEHVKGEARLKPKEGDKVKAGGKELTWKPYQNKEYYFDINAFLGDQVENHAGYAVCYIEVDRDMKGLEVRAGTNDSGKIYLNGKEILAADASRAIDKDQESVKDIGLNKGVNTLVFKVINDTNDWAGCIRFMDKDGKPIQDLKIGLAPPAENKAEGGPSPAPAKPGLNLNTAKAYSGYTLFSPTYAKKFYLIDMDGKLVKEWDAAATPSAHAMLLPSGNFLRPCVWQVKGGAGGGGAGGRIQEFSWDGTLVWHYTCPPNKRQHHDCLKLPNGNVLMPVWDVRSAQDCADAGRRGGGGNISFDSIIEVRPNGMSGGDIVWEWNLWDHLVQDFDKSKKNFGDVAAHPELVDINIGAPKGAAKDPDKKDKGGPGGGKGGGEFTHVNGISYNPELDQIMLSAHRLSELWIIDHSTTTAEAASHKGGKSGKGGDLLYRWGNPQIYRAGTAAQRELFSQHNAHWVPKGLPGAGNILVYNNGSGRPGGPFSSVDEIVPPVDAKGNYAIKAGAAFGPEKPAWTYVAPTKTDFYSTYISGAQRLPNGNTLICSGANGTFFEVTAQKEVVWKYVNPTPGKGGPGKGGPGGKAGGGDVFRAHRYAADYPGLVGRDLTPGKSLEDLLKKDGK